MYKLATCLTVLSAALSTLTNAQQTPGGSTAIEIVSFALSVPKGGTEVDQVAFEVAFMEFNQLFDCKADLSKGGLRVSSRVCFFDDTSHCSTRRLSISHSHSHSHSQSLFDMLTDMSSSLETPPASHANDTLSTHRSQVNAKAAPAPHPSTSRSSGLDRRCDGPGSAQTRSLREVWS